MTIFTSTGSSDNLMVIPLDSSVFFHFLYISSSHSQYSFSSTTDEIFQIGEGIKPLVHSSFSLLKMNTLLDFMKFCNEELSPILSSKDVVMSNTERNADPFSHGSKTNRGFVILSEVFSISPVILKE